MTKVVFIEPSVEKQDLLLSSFQSDVITKVKSTFDLNDIPEDATHLSFLYHEVNAFPFVTEDYVHLKSELDGYRSRRHVYYKNNCLKINRKKRYSTTCHLLNNRITFIRNQCTQIHISHWKNII